MSNQKKRFNDLRKEVVAAFSVFRDFLYLAVFVLVCLGVLFVLVDGISGGGSSSFDSDYERPSRYW